MHTLYNKIDVLINKMQHFHEDANLLMQSMGFNGFKRWHRYSACCLHRLKMLNANELFDYHGETIQFNRATGHHYHTASLKEHLVAWEKEIKHWLEELAILQQEFFERTGGHHCCVAKMMCMSLHDCEKVRRYYRRFEENKWLAHDVYIVDMMVHTKYKKKEEKHHTKKHKHEVDDGYAESNPYKE